MTATPIFKSTNENLEAIVLALRPTKTDRILAVGGSGDQAFALLEHAGKVYCVDNDETQVEYAAQRVEQLKNGDREAFLSQGWNYERNEYFQAKGRAQRIRENFGNLNITCADVFETAKKGGFTKAYLSNAIGYIFCSILGRESLTARFEKCIACVAKNLPQNGLIYVSDHEFICKELKDSDVLDDPIITEDGIIRISNPKKLLPTNVIIDHELTTIARRYEDHSIWAPAVYRKAV